MKLAVGLVATAVPRHAVVRVRVRGRVAVKLTVGLTASAVRSATCREHCRGISCAAPRKNLVMFSASILYCTAVSADNNVNIRTNDTRQVKWKLRLRSIAQNAKSHVSFTNSRR